MNDGKLKERIGKYVFNKKVYDILDEAKKDIFKKIKEYEYEDIPDDVMKEKIIEWFGDEE